MADATALTLSLACVVFPVQPVSFLHFHLELNVSGEGLYNFVVCSMWCQVMVAEIVTGGELVLATCFTMFDSL